MQILTKQTQIRNRNEKWSTKLYYLKNNFLIKINADAYI